jgi:SPX domain protein involved in polyphosphate accumulation
MIKRFNRFELKYLITSAVRDALLPELTLQVVPDPEGGATGVYQVTSLYYDTDDLFFFRSKVDGNRFRRKVRIRQYGEFSASPEAPCMLEIKQRIGRTTQKRRVALTLGRAEALCRGELDDVIWSDVRDSEVAGEVEFLVRNLRLRPTCLVSYLRQAFMGGRYEPGLRVTFDRALWASAGSEGFTPGARHHFVSPDAVVMEVKANDAVPQWMSRMLARHGCEITRFSKYVAGVAYMQALRDRGGAQWMN